MSLARATTNGALPCTASSVHSPPGRNIERPPHVIWEICYILQLLRLARPRSRLRSPGIFRFGSPVCRPGEAAIQLPALFRPNYSTHDGKNYDKQSSQHTTTAKATTSTGEGRPGRHASFCSVCSHHISSHQQQGAAGFVQGLSFDEQRHDGQARRREVAERAEGRQGDALHARGDNKGVYLLCGVKGHPPRNTTSANNKNKNRRTKKRSISSHPKNVFNRTVAKRAGHQGVRLWEPAY